MDSQCKVEIQLSSQALHETQCDQQNSLVTEAPVADSGSISIASNDNKKISRKDIELVQNLIERCLQLYMNKGEVIMTLSNRARIEPAFTTLVWQKLEEENSDFFRAYYIRLKLKKQIILFNRLLEHQYHLMQYPVLPNVSLAPVLNGIHPRPANNLPMGYPVIQQPHMPATSHHHRDSMGCVMSSYHVVDGIPAPGGFHAIRMNSGNDAMMDNDTPEDVPPCSAMSTVSEMAVSPGSVASNNHFPFTPSEISGMGMDEAALDTTFISDVASTGGLQLGPDGGVGSSRDSFRSLGQLWNFSLTDLTSLGDLGPLENYTGSPFLPSDSEILLDSPEQDDIVEEYFADAALGPCSQSDEEQS